VTLLLIPGLMLVAYVGVRLRRAGRLNIRIAATLAGLTGSLVALTRGVDAGVSRGDSTVVAGVVWCVMSTLCAIYLLLRRRAAGSGGVERMSW
jgi:hypothetical protein